jgi:hypothetical protein
MLPAMLPAMFSVAVGTWAVEFVADHRFARPMVPSRFTLPSNRYLLCLLADFDIARLDATHAGSRHFRPGSSD